MAKGASVACPVVPALTRRTATKSVSTGRSTQRYGAPCKYPTPTASTADAKTAKKRAWCSQRKGFVSTTPNRTSAIVSREKRRSGVKDQEVHLSSILERYSIGPSGRLCVLSSPRSLPHKRARYARSMLCRSRYLARLPPQGPRSISSGESDRGGGAKIRSSMDLAVKRFS
jgi:hypothetical protein